MADEIQMSSARRFAQRFVVSGVRNGLSANAIQANLQAAGLGYRRADLLADVARYANVPTTRRGYSDLNLDQLIPPDITIRMPTTGGTRYQYVFSVPATDVSSGEQFDITYSIVSPFELLPALATALARVNVDFEQNYNATPDLEGLELIGANTFYSEVP